MTGAGFEEESERDWAGEYVLGVLSGEERRLVERRASADSGLRREIEEWQARFGPLISAVEPIPAPSDLWAKIDAELGGLTRRPAEERPVGEAARRPGHAREGRAMVAAYWRSLALGATAATAASLAFAVVVGSGILPWRHDTGAPLTATLADSAGRALVTVVVDRGNGSATLIPVAAPSAEARVPELWLLPPGGAAPRPLGLLDGDRPLTLDLSTGDVPATGAALAISLEPEGGSPTGAPTGPVVAYGPLNAV